MYSMYEEKRPRIGREKGSAMREKRRGKMRRIKSSTKYHVTTMGKDSDGQEREREGETGQAKSSQIDGGNGD